MDVICRRCFGLVIETTVYTESGSVQAKRCLICGTYEFPVLEVCEFPVKEEVITFKGAEHMKCGGCRVKQRRRNAFAAYAQAMEGVD